ncbi:MAG TPA: hypothetical protein VIW26_15750 [Gemmatimonadales bacterium]
MLPSLRTCCTAAAVALVAAARLAAQETTTVGGYGEVQYVNPSGAPATVDLRRFVVYLAHTFSDRIALRSEVEVEHAKVEASDSTGEIEVEQVVFDYKLGERVTLRSGLLLVPLGIINEVHEPPTFNGVARPAFDEFVIPTTWREIGAGFTGSFADGWNYRLYLLNGLRAAGFTADGTREGSGEGQAASFANPSVSGRVEVVRPGLRAGASFWYGGTTGGDTLLGRGAFSRPVTFLAADVRYDVGGLAVRAEIANVAIPDAAAINARYGGAVGRRIAGGYAEAAVNLLHWLAPASTQKLALFARHERFDTQASVAPGTTRDGTRDRRVTTVGLTYKPTWNTAFKGDYQVLRNAANTGEGEALSLGIGFQF